jgi:hypothetical protein
LISEKPEGSLAKRKDRTGIFCLEPLDLDLAVWIYHDLDLILTVGFELCGSDLKRRAKRYWGI